MDGDARRALPYEQAIERYGPGVKRAFVHKALNRLLQGSAADLMKQAMRDVDRSGVESIIGPPLLTCHDELGHSLPRTKAAQEAFAHVKHIMENTMKITVPIMAEQSTGANWGACT